MLWNMDSTNPLQDGIVWWKMPSVKLSGHVYDSVCLKTKLHWICSRINWKIEKKKKKKLM